MLLGQVAQADHPEWLRVLVADEDARDLPLFHQLGDLLHVFVGPDADYVLGHDLLDLGAFQIAGLGDEAHDDVAVGDDTDRLARRVDHGQEADVLLGHLAGDLLDAGVRTDGDDVAFEQFLHAHEGLRAVWVARKMRTRAAGVSGAGAAWPPG